MAQVVIDKLTKIFPGQRGQTIPALREVSLTVEDGSLLTVVGPSGCGKTTLLRIIAGLDEPTSGSITIGGRRMDRVRANERDVAMVFQSPALYPHLTAYENMAFGLTLRHVRKTEVRRRVQGIAELLHLTDCLQRRPMELSGGQRQRVALARALVRRPAVLLLDEPLANLDLQLQQHLRAEITRMHQHLGSTYIYVTHDQGEAMSVGDRVALLNHGGIEQTAEPLELYRNPANLFVAGFIGSPPTNLFHGALTLDNGNLLFNAIPPESGKSSFYLRLHETFTPKLKNYFGKEVILGLRPEHIRLQASPWDASDSLVEARVERMEILGAQAHLYLLNNGKRFVILAPTNRRFRPGDLVCVTFDLRSAWFFDSSSRQRIA